MTKESYEEPSVEVISASTVAATSALLNSSWGGGGGGGGGGGYTPPTGSSSSHPEYMTVDRERPYTGKAKHYWFKVSPTGSFDISATAPFAHIRLYTIYNGYPEGSAKLTGYEELYITYAIWGTVSFFIEIESNTGASVEYSIAVRTHQDFASYAELTKGQSYQGVVWEPSDGGRYNADIMPVRVWYLESQYVEYMVAILEDDDFISFAYAEGLDVAKDALVKGIKKINNLVGSIASALLDPIFDMNKPETTDEYLAELRALTNRGSGLRTYKFVDVYKDTYSMESWSPAIDHLYGPLGTSGSWKGL